MLEVLQLAVVLALTNIVGTILPLQAILHYIYFVVV
jgi:hypothetical protein